MIGEFPLFTGFQKVQNIIAELLDSSEPLIHDTYGCGSQGLINLMITGQAVPHVWDHDKDVGGLSESNPIFNEPENIEYSRHFMITFRIERDIATVRHWISHFDGATAILYRWIFL